MLVRTHSHLELEIIKWLAILTLATALALALTGNATGGSPDERPPLAAASAYHDALPLQDETPQSDDPYITAWKTWRALERTEQRDFETARAAWTHLKLPGSLDAWRQVALAAIELEAGNVGQAVEMLNTARHLDEHQALAAFYLGVARVKQAATAREWLDAMGPRSTLWISTQDVSPNTRSMYLRVAIEEFHRAIELAGELDLERSLIDVPWVTPEDEGAAMPLAAPTVRNLLNALHAEDFLGRSHQNLGKLYLLNDAVESAERHLDEAAKLELSVREDYRALGRRYELLGRPLDAARAHLKAMREGGPVIGPTRSILDNLSDQLLRRGS